MFVSGVSTRICSEFTWVSQGNGKQCLGAGGGKEGEQGMLTPSQHSSGAASSATQIHGTGAAHMRSWQ